MAAYYPNVSAPFEVRSAFSGIAGPGDYGFDGYTCPVNPDMELREGEVIVGIIANGNNTSLMFAREEDLPVGFVQFAEQALERNPATGMPDSYFPGELWEKWNELGRPVYLEKTWLVVPTIKVGDIWDGSKVVAVWGAGTFATEETYPNRVSA